jgi:subtilisin family serine protease
MIIKRLLATLVAVLLLTISGTAVTQTASDKPFIDPELRSSLQARGVETSLIYLREKPDLSPAFDMSWEERGWFVYNTLKAAADQSQAELKRELDAMGADYRAFWIDNVIAVRNTDLQMLNMLASRQDVRAVILEPIGFVPEPPANLTNEENQIEAVVDSLVQIRVPDAWALGFTGQGVTVGIIDSGTRYTHNALVNNYRGNQGGGVFDHNYHWFDVGGSTAPTWPNPHGSHVTGTAVGDDGGSNQIGAAPDAEWVSCLGCTSTSCPGTNLLACGEFMAAPTDLAGNNPDPSQRVHVVNNSWGSCEQSYDGWYQGVVDGWVAAGVVPIVSNGNASNCGYSSPPGPNTVGNPARYASVLGIGSSQNNNGLYANHSNWGPTDNPNDGTNPALPDPMGYFDLKPNVIAPGVSICSVNSNGGDSGYTCGFTGTSMSAPAASGVIALMISAAPSLAGDFATLGTVLMQTARPIDYNSGVGGEGPGNVPNYATGWGEIDALAAVQGAILAAGPRGTLSGTVTDSATSNPIAGVTVSTEDFSMPPIPISTTTDASGNYTLSLAETGPGQSYDIAYSRNGYETVTVTGFTILDGQTPVLDQQLTAVAGVAVSGQVTNVDTAAPVAGASLLFTDGDGFDYGPATTDASGNYSIDLPPGLTYDVAISQSAYETLNTNIGTVTAPSTFDFSLQGVTEIVLPASVDITVAFPNSTAEAITIQNFGALSGDVTLDITAVALEEDFEGAFPPDGWTVTDSSTPACPWTTTDQLEMTGWPGGGTRAAAADSDDCGSGVVVETALISPSLNLAGSTGSVTLDFDFAFRAFGGSAVTLSVSTDGGSSWTDIDSWTGTSVAYPGVATLPQSYDLSAYAGESDVRLRWLYTAGWDWWVVVDNVTITAPVSWAQVNPAVVSVPGESTAQTDVEVNSSGLPGPGIYQAVMSGTATSPFAIEPSLVTLTVIPGGDAAGINGTVQGLGYCSANPSAAAGASIEVVGVNNTYNATADASGFYELFVPVGESPVDITATAAGHIVGSVSGVVLTGGAIETVDFGLLLDAACASASPSALSITMEPDTTDSLTATLANDGAADYSWSIDFEQVSSDFAGGSTDVVNDGGFELGTPNGAWTEASANFGTPLCDVPSCGTGGGTGPRTGAWWAWFGGIAAAETGSVSQDVTLPTGPSAELRFWLEIPASGQPGTMDVSLDGNVLFSVAETDTGSYSTYTEVVIDVSSFADGGTYTLEFSSQTLAGASATNFFVDDVSLVVQPGPVDCSDPLGVSWLSVDPASGTVSAQSTADATVTFDSTGVAPGNYQANLCLTTSDSNADLIVIPVDFSVFSDAVFEDRFEGAGTRSSNPEDALRKTPN